MSVALTDDAGCLMLLTRARIIEVSGLDMTDATYLRQHVQPSLAPSRTGDEVK